MSRRNPTTDTIDGRTSAAGELAEQMDAQDVVDLTGAADAKGRKDKKRDKKAKKAEVEAPVLEEFPLEHDTAASTTWSITVAVSLSIGLLFSGSSLLGTLDGTAQFGGALLQLALVSTVALVGISALTAMFHHFSAAQEDDETDPTSLPGADAATLATGTTDADVSGA